MYCFVVLYHIIILFTSGFAQHVVCTWWGGGILSVWNDDDNLIILNVGVYCNFSCVWNGSGVTLILLQLVHDYK